MRTNILILLFTSVLTTVGLSATLSEVVLTHPDGTVTPPGQIATSTDVSASVATQLVTQVKASAALAAANAVRTSIAGMYTNKIVVMSGFCQSANSASAVSDTNVHLVVTSLSATNGIGYLKVNSSKALTVSPELRFAASIGPSESFSNLTTGVTCSWPTTVANDSGFTNGVSYLYTYTTTTPNGFYFVYADPMIIPPSGDYLLVSGSININGWVGMGAANAPEILYDRDGKKLTLVGGTAVQESPESIETLMAYFGQTPVRLAFVPAKAKGGTYETRL